jgi:hypothetical protein
LGDGQSHPFSHSSFRATDKTHASWDDSVPDKMGDDQFHQSGVESQSIRWQMGECSESAELLFDYFNGVAEIGSVPMAPSRMRMIRRM